MPTSSTGVVQVDLEIAAGLDGEVEAGVLAELLEHVVEERDAGGHRRGSGSVDVELELDRGSPWSRACAAPTGFRSSTSARSPDHLR
jgi:hypothetical protein